MEDLERMVRHLEEVVAEIEVLKARINFLEDHRTELRERITSLATRTDSRTLELELLPAVSTSRRPLRPSESLSLRQAADMVAAIGGEVTADMLSEKLRISFDAARLRLARAARKGLVMRVSLGKYRASNRGEPAHTNGIMRN
jgi:hypothetical protein